MPGTWTTIATSDTASWSSLPEAQDDWVDPRMTLLLTEDGMYLLSESGDFLATEAMSSAPAGVWVSL